MEAWSGAAAAVPRAGPASGGSFGEILPQGQRGGDPARADHRGPAEAQRVGECDSSSLNINKPNNTSQSLQLHGVNAHIHGERRSPVHKVCVFLQERARIHFAVHSSHSGAAGSGVWEREGSE